MTLTTIFIVIGYLILFLVIYGLVDFIVSQNKNIDSLNKKVEEHKETNEKLRLDIRKQNLLLIRYKDLLNLKKETSYL